MKLLALTIRCLLLAVVLIMAAGGEAFCADHDHAAESQTARTTGDCACLCHTPTMPQMRLTAPIALPEPSALPLPTNQVQHDAGYRYKVFQPPKRILA
jgi:hypothetical protein